MEKRYEWMEDLDVDTTANLFKATKESVNAPKTRRRELTDEQIWESQDSLYILGERRLHELAKKLWGDWWR